MPEKILPHNREAEQSAIGAALSNENALAEVIKIVKHDDFYDSAHREIFTVMEELAENDKNVDIVTVTNALKRKGSLEAAGGSGYIADLPNLAPLARNAAGYAEIVAEKSSLRRLISVAEEIKVSGFDEDMDAKDILDNAEQKIFEIAKSRQMKSYSPIGDVLNKNLEMIDRAANNQGRLLGLTTGYSKLDDMTSGLQKSDLIILAARPSMGKSAFALNLALNAASKVNASVIVFNLEMSETQLGMRLLSMESSVDIKKIKEGSLTGDEWRAISVATDKLSNCKIAIDDTPGISVLEIKNKCRRLQKEQGLDLIIVDYLQLMDIGGKVENRQQEIGRISRSFKLLAKELDCPVLLLSQLSREPEKRSEHRPIPADLRDSGSIEQDADVIMFLYRDEVYHEDTKDPGICEVIVAKHRNGPTGTVKLTFVERYTRFNEIAFSKSSSGDSY